MNGTSSVTLCPPTMFGVAEGGGVAGSPGTAWMVDGPGEPSAVAGAAVTIAPAVSAKQHTAGINCRMVGLRIAKTPNTQLSPDPGNSRGLDPPNEAQRGFANNRGGGP
ncbi:hypothetical protein GCM10009754_54950 [Amycolatopsis minnesotensis]|uniref:Uncharacterized protein n=1 Tax=Amycolatopsis minnesotensis TaxID=337894 RepID=A0ABP5D2Y0_9PSEU